MNETVVDQRGRVLIPEEIRQTVGLHSGTVVAVKKERNGIVIELLSKGKRGWRQVCGVVPKRTGKPEWPTPEQIKAIWR